MLSSALMAVLITSTPAQPSQPLPARQTAPVDQVCSAQWVDRKFVHYVEKTPGEKGAPGLRLIADELAPAPLVTDKGSSCVIQVTRFDLVR